MSCIKQKHSCGISLRKCFFCFVCPFSAVPGGAAGETVRAGCSTHMIQKPNTFYYGSPCNKFYRRDLLRKHSLHFRKELFAEDQLFNTEYLRYVRTAVSIPDIGYYYLQNSQSVSHSRVTTADILSLRRRVMLLYRDIYTELGIYPETRAAILRSPFGENEFTLPPLDTPQTHCCKL